MADEPLLWLVGDGDFEFEIVGESYKQEALLSLCGPKTDASVDLNFVAMIIHEPDNKFDKNAMAVAIHGKVVGHIPREEAAELRRYLLKQGIDESACFVQAKVVGGWLRTKNGKTDDAMFGVELDMNWPPETIPALDILSYDATAKQMIRRNY